MFSRHVTNDISAYCHGELSSEESKQFAAHLISCVGCRAKFEDVKLGIKLAEQLPQLSAPDYLWRDHEPLLAKETTASSSVSWSWQLKAAAAVVLLLLSGLTALLVYNGRKPARGPAIASGASFWRVTRLDGTPRIGSEQIAN